MPIVVVVKLEESVVEAVEFVELFVKVVEGEVKVVVEVEVVVVVSMRCVMFILPKNKIPWNNYILKQTLRYILASIILFAVNVNQSQYESISFKSLLSVSSSIL